MALPGRLGTVARVSGQRNRRNHYRILHVQHDAPLAVIKSSYRALMLSLEMHPDRGGDHWNAALVNEAYRVLSDPESRAAYDRTLGDSVLRRRGEGDGEQRRSGGFVAARTGVDRELCLFCGAESPVSPGSPALSCVGCSSPLTLVPTPGPAGRGRRTTERIARESGLRYYVEWPQRVPGRGRLVDVSAGGLRFVTATTLELARIIKLDSPLLDAVGRVASCLPDADGWSIGVEFYTLRLRNERGTFLSTTA